MDAFRTIKLVARQTGLSVHAIRIWEKRYGAVQPVRAENNRRLYSEEDVERLRLLREATLAGHGIAQIARASLPELTNLVRDAGRSRALQSRALGHAGDILPELMILAVEAIREFDAVALSRVLDSPRRIWHNLRGSGLSGPAARCSA